MRKIKVLSFLVCVMPVLTVFSSCEKYSIVGECTLVDETKKRVVFDGADLFFTLKDDGKWASPFRVIGYKRGVVAYDRVFAIRNADTNELYAAELCKKEGKSLGEGTRQFIHGPFYGTVAYHTIDNAYVVTIHDDFPYTPPGIPRHSWPLFDSARRIMSGPATELRRTSRSTGRHDRVCDCAFYYDKESGGYSISFVLDRITDKREVLLKGKVEGAVSQDYSLTKTVTFEKGEGDVDVKIAENAKGRKAVNIVIAYDGHTYEGNFLLESHEDGERRSGVAYKRPDFVGESSRAIKIAATEYEKRTGKKASGQWPWSVTRNGDFYEVRGNPSEDKVKEGVGAALIVMDKDMNVVSVTVDDVEGVGKNDGGCPRRVCP